MKVLKAEHLANSTVSLSISNGISEPLKVILSYRGLWYEGGVKAFLNILKIYEITKQLSDRGF